MMIKLFSFGGWLKSGFYFDIDNWVSWKQMSQLMSKAFSLNFSHN